MHTYCGNLTEVILPDTVTSIGENAFYSCTSLQNIYVNDTDGQGYTSIDGVLYSYNQQSQKYTLEYYPYGRKDTSYTIHKNTSTINTEAFFRCENLEKIVFPKGVSVIGENAGYTERTADIEKKCI